MNNSSFAVDSRTPVSPLRTSSPGRIVELDSLRGLAALAVVLFHFTTRYDQLFGYESGLGWAVPWGSYGVELFFMLSGFVILGSLERTRSAGQFVVNRLARLFPAYWVAVAVTFGVVSLVGLPGQEVTWAEAAMNLSMVQGLFHARHVDGAYWSLQAELFFYVGALALIHRSGKSRWPLALVGWLVLSTAVTWALARFADEEVAGVWRWVSRLQTVASLKYIHLFAVGMVLYAAHRAGRISWGGWGVLLACCGQRAWLDSWTAAAAVAGLALLLWLAVQGALPCLRWRPLVFLGEISYSLYLLHQNLGYLVIRHLESHGWPPLACQVAALAMALLAATALRRLVEVPGQRLIQAVFPGNRKAGASRDPATTTANNGPFAVGPALPA